MDEEDEEEEEDEGRSGRKDNSEALLEILKDARAEMVAERTKYESSYYTSKLTADDDQFMKLYLMTMGLPGKNGSTSGRAPRKKILTAYIGGSFEPTQNRVFKHNSVGAMHSNPRTRNGATLWTLCMILFIPTVLREKISSKIIRRFWGAAHGPGKIKRGLMLQQMFGLTLYVPPEVKSIVDGHKPPRKLLGFEEYNFRE